MTSTANMSLTLGVSGYGGNTEQEWANLINQALTALDAHNHATGSGVQVPTAGMNINANLSFNSYEATGLKTSAYTSQSASLASTFKSCVYVVNGNLYFNNGSGSAVQVTTGTAVNVGGTGTISGMSGTAAVAFDGSAIFSFSRSSGVYADLAVSGMRLYHSTTGAANALTMGVASNLTTAYSILFPNQTPSAAGGDIFPELDTSGNVTWKKSIVNGGSNAVGRVGYFTDAKTLASIALSAGQLLIGTTSSTAPSAATLTGTTNQVTVTTGSGSITLSIPQNIHTAATPTFAGLTLSGTLSGTSASLSSTLGVTGTATFSGTVNVATLTASRLVATDDFKNLSTLEYDSANVSNALVRRSGSGDFAANSVTLAGTLTAAALSVSGNGALTGYLNVSDDSQGIRVKRVTQSVTATGTYSLAHGLSSRSRILFILGYYDNGSITRVMDASTNFNVNRMEITSFSDTSISVSNNVSGSYTVTLYIIYTS